MDRTEVQDTARPAGKAVCKGLSVSVSVKDTDIFQHIIGIFKELLGDERTPDWIKDKIRNLVMDEMKT